MSNHQRSRRPGLGGRVVLVGAVAGILAGCGSAPPPTAAPPASPTQSPTQDPSSATAARLESCDAADLIPCLTADAVVSIPIADTGLSLTYTSRLAAGRQGRPDWDPATLGLGGWSLDAVDGYAAKTGELVHGDGTWRLADLVPATNGETAVPAWDAATADVFDAAGHHVRTVDGRLGTPLLTIAYDDAGRLVSVKGSIRGAPVGLTVQRTTDGSPTALLGLDGASSALTLDPHGLLSSVRDPRGGLVAFQWQTGGLLSAWTDPAGAATSFTYDAQGRLASTTDPDGIVDAIHATTGATSDEVTTTTPLGRVTTYRVEVSPTGVTRTFTRPDGTTTTESEAASGDRSLALPDGTREDITAAKSALWGSDAPVLATDVRTRSDGATTTSATTESLQPIDGRPYAVSGTVTTTVDGASWTETIDAGARTVTVADPTGLTGTTTVNEAGRIVRATAPGRAPVSWAYDSIGRLAGVTEGTGTSARSTTFAFDPASGRMDVRRPDGSTNAVWVDQFGRQLGTMAADGSTTITTRDTTGRVSEIQPPGGLGYTLGTSAAGRGTAFLPPFVSGETGLETSTSDADGNLASVAGPRSNTIGLLYDDRGRIAGWQTAQGRTTIAYDPTTGRPASSTDASGISTAYTYDGGAEVGLAWSGPFDASVKVALDDLGRPIGTAVDDEPSIATAYDAGGRLSSVGPLAITRDPATGLVRSETIGSVRIDLSWDEHGELARSTTTTPGGVALDRTYSRDAFGRITGITQAAGGKVTRTEVTYDPGDRLSSLRVNGRVTETDRYDAAGDRTAVTTGAGTAKPAYDDRQRLVTWGNTGYAWRADGTLAAIKAPSGTTSLTFDDLGRLTDVELPNGSDVSYLVDADGRRIGRKVAGTLIAGYLYDPAGRVVAETDDAQAVVTRFGYDDQGHLALLERDGLTFAVVTDQVGSPLLMIDTATGNIGDAITYDAWGRVTSETNPGWLPFGFAGGLRDPDTGFVHFGARDYDPATGRWLSSDPIRFAGGDANLYRYAGGDPVDRTDMSGLCNGAAFFLAGALLVGTFGLGGLAGGYIAAPPCQPDPPAPPQNPTHYGNCAGDECAFGKNLGCYQGFCSNGPGGFYCVAYICNGPNGAGSCHGASAEQPCTVWTGDVHGWTADGLHIDVQAAGEFVGARSPDGSLEVQVRQEPILGGTTITFVTAVALDVAGDRVGIYAHEPDTLVVDGHARSAADIVERLPHGGTLERHGGEVTVAWPDGSRVTVETNAHTLGLMFSPSASIAPTLRGLFGTDDGDRTNDLTARDGTVLAPDDPDLATKMYRQFVDTWRVSDSESLFDYRAGESTATFTRKDIPTSDVNAATLPADARAAAEAACRAVGVRSEPLLDDCILDVAETGNPAYAAASAAVAAARGPLTTTWMTSSPGGSGPQQLVLGQDVSGTISSTTETDDYTFTASAGDIVYGHTEGECAHGLGWVLQGPDHGLLGMGPTTCQDVGRVVLPSAGTYTVRVTSSGTDTGAYRFVLTAVPATKVDPIGVGQTVTGSLDAPGELHDYTFAASAGQKVSIQASGACPDHLSWNLLRPDGSLLDFHVACGSMGPDVIAAPGTYTLRLLGDGPAIGASAFIVATAP